MSRQHGTRACYVHGPDKGTRPGGCRCQPCRDANNAAVRAYNRRTAPTLVDAGETRRHVHNLMDAGLGPLTIAKLSGVSTGGLSKLIYGDYTRGTPPTRRIRPATRDRLLAVKVTDAIGDQRVDAGSTWRRIDTLIARGWTKTAIARAIGQRGPALQLGRRLVHARNARAVEALLDQPVPPRQDRWGNTYESGWKPGRDRSTGGPQLERLKTLPRLPDTARAACRHHPTWMFYPADSDAATIAAAKAVCATCPIRQACLDGAIERDERYGVWGGLTHAERLQVTPGVEHGTYATYVRGCRCEACTDANYRYGREYAEETA